VQLSELTIEVRDPNLNRVGRLMQSDLVGAVFITRYNQTGTWSVDLNQDSFMAGYLRTPGFGLIVTGPTGVIISGPMRSAKLSQTRDNAKGTWLIEGTGDGVILTERLAYPDPSEADVTLQSQAYDVRTGNAETVIKGYVADNISAYSGTIRSIGYLDIEADIERGEIVTGSARFDNLQELLFPLGQTGGVGYQVAQNGDVLEFQVYVPTDRSATIRMDVQNNKLTSTEYSYAGPRATRAIVGGSGEETGRIFYEGFSTDSIATEIVWGRRIETFLDDRSNSETAALDQKAQELLVDNGKTIVNLAVTPSDDVNMVYAVDWFLGDVVTVVVNDLEAVAVVTEIGISIESDGVRIGATLGTPNATDFESKLIAKQSSTDLRVGNLERNTGKLPSGFGVAQYYTPTGATTGTQPVFSANPFTASYTQLGSVIHFQIQVDFSSITSFGTGNYSVTLPEVSKYDYQFRDGCLHDDSANRQYSISGHVSAGSNQVFLFTTDLQGNRIYDFEFTNSEPVTLTTADNFHIAGTYEIEV
jgi:hypothetical protein